ncbi:MAG: hypothetical protein R2861_07120 [Desulfobacterales bacterium]
MNYDHQRICSWTKECFLNFKETYNAAKIQSAIMEEKEALIAAIRTPNLYPIAEYVENDTVIDQFDNAPSEEPVNSCF